MDPDERYERLILKKLRVNWGRAAASQIKRILTDAGRLGTNVLKVDVPAVRERKACVAFGKAPRLPAAGTSVASAINGKVQVGLLFLGNLITLHSMGLFSCYSLSVTAPSKKTDGGMGCLCGLLDYGIWKAGLPVNGQRRRKLCVLEETSRNC